MECGVDLKKPEQVSSVIDSLPQAHASEPLTAGTAFIDSERKHITVLFSDLSGYTAMSEKVDPEEVKEIINRIFGEIAQVVTKYEGHIARFIGDAVMVFFGVPRAHEDDPVRAIKTAWEIHDLVEAFSPKIADRIGKPLSMHTGINSGLVVTGEFDFDKGRHGFTGDAINIASRLTDIAKAGEILVGSNTYSQAEGYFNFEYLKPAVVKGKTEPIRIYKVISPKEQPRKTYRLHGLRADMIGREAEMAQLEEAIDGLQQGTGSIVSISGGAGTGKSRLVEEFKATLDLKKIRWIEGHAYAYTQNIPYFPLIDLLNRTFQIEESDSQKNVKEKIETRTQSLIGDKTDIIPYIGSLFSIGYPEVDRSDPEFWKTKLQNAIREILSALTKDSPTVICLEDLHWADPSSLELIRLVTAEFSHPGLIIYVYRTGFTLLSSHEVGTLETAYREIHLKDLSSPEESDMVESLLKTRNIPDEFMRFIHEKIQGNPFYLEEVINSLIESETLIRDNGDWRLTRAVNTQDIPPTIHGVISARLDRLEKNMKRLLQEASVIGRVFDYKILKNITEIKASVDKDLDSLERLDLVKKSVIHANLEYVFKHVLTQEVVYNGLLKKERQVIHGRIGRVMETLFEDRLPEFYEILAFHFKQSKSLTKAVDYLLKSGEASLGKYSLAEAHQYYKEAFMLLEAKSDKTKEDDKLLIDILLKWMLVFYFQGRYREMTEMISANQGIAESLGDKYRLGMYYMWLGMTFYSGEKFNDAFLYLNRALEIGEEIENLEIIGHTCTWFSYTCADMGLLDEAVAYGKRAVETGRVIETGYYPYHLALGGLGYAYWVRGESKKAFRVGKILLDYGRENTSIRALVFGHWVMGFGYLVDGNFSKAIECNKRAVEISEDPWYAQFPLLHLSLSYASNGQFKEAIEPLETLLSFCETYGGEILGTPAKGLLGAVLVANGQMSRGIRKLESVRQCWLENECKWRYVNAEHVFGNLYYQILEGATPISPAIFLKNIRFLLKNVPFASRKAEYHLKNAIEMAQKIKAKGLLGHCYYRLGLLYKLKGRKKEAKDCLSSAIQYFALCEAETSLLEAEETLSTL